MTLLDVGVEADAAKDAPLDAPPDVLPDVSTLCTTTCTDEFTCCTGNTCLNAKDMSVSACGSFGEQCKVCVGAGVWCWGRTGSCMTPVSNCGPDNCNGCCIDDTHCTDGNEYGECGSHGEKCEECYGRACIARDGGGGSCEDIPSCGPSNCAGCCFLGKCVSGHSFVQCGTNGAACEACPDGMSCVSPGTTGGATCQGLPFCTPQTCKTCCVGNVCVPGDTDTACGAGAVTACRDCTKLGETCVKGSCQ